MKISKIFEPFEPLNQKPNERKMDNQKNRRRKCTMNCMVWCGVRSGDGGDHESPRRHRRCRCRGRRRPRRHRHSQHRAK